MNLSHCHIQVSDMKAVRNFYQEIFEFVEDFVCDEDEVFLRNSADFILGLERVDSPEALPKWFHFGFDAKSEEKLQKVYDKAQLLGVSILREIKDFGDSVNFYCADPDGTQIEVYFNRK